MKTFKHSDIPTLEVGQMFSRYRTPLCSSNNGPVVITKIEYGVVHYRYTGGHRFTYSQVINAFLYGVFLSTYDPFDKFDKEE